MRKIANVWEIAEITEEQKAQIPQYVEEGLKISRRTTPLDRKLAKKIVQKVYKKAGLAKPDVLFFDSPKAVRKYILANGGTEEDVYSYFSGNLDIGYFQYDKFHIDNFGLKRCGISAKAWNAYASLLELHMYWTFENVALLSEFPIEIHIDENGKLHAEGKPALAYKDGWGLYRVHGEPVDSNTIEAI